MTLETRPISTDNLVSCIACQQNTNRLAQLSEELVIVKEELVRLINRFESMREVNNLWDGS